MVVAGRLRCERGRRPEPSFAQSRRHRRGGWRGPIEEIRVRRGPYPARARTTASGSRLMAVSRTRATRPGTRRHRFTGSSPGRAASADPPARPRNCQARRDRQQGGQHVDEDIEGVVDAVGQERLDALVEPAQQRGHD